VIARGWVEERVARDVVTESDVQRRLQSWVGQCVENDPAHDYGSMRRVEA